MLPRRFEFSIAHSAFATWERKRRRYATSSHAEYAVLSNRRSMHLHLERNVTLAGPFGFPQIFCVKYLTGHKDSGKEFIPTETPVWQTYTQRRPPAHRTVS